MASVTSHPTRGAWIEITAYKAQVAAEESHPTRGAWIEIIFGPKLHDFANVAPHTGCVD